MGSSFSDGWNNFFVPNIGDKEGKNPIVSGEKNMLCNQRLRHIEEKGLWVLYGKGMVEGMYNFSLDFDFYKHFLYGKHNHVSLSYGAIMV